MGSKVAALAAAAVVAVLGMVHCGGPAKEGGEGAECFRADECAPGLVCIGASSADKVCTSDLTSVNFRSDAGVTVDAASGAGD
jgi:hypothetical protein